MVGGEEWEQQQKLFNKTQSPVYLKLKDHQFI